MCLWEIIAYLFGTFVLAAVAIFGKSIRGRWYKPVLEISTKTEPPHCISAPFRRSNDTFVSDSIYLRIWVENTGNLTAKLVEVYANYLRRKRAEGDWERVKEFPLMNLRWSHLGSIYFPSIAPNMGKHCDVGHIADPEHRHRLNEDSKKLKLTNQQASLAFDLMAKPHYRGHIIGPGEYELDVIVAAENARPIKGTIGIYFSGVWHLDEEKTKREDERYADEDKMLRDEVAIKVVRQEVI